MIESEVDCLDAVSVEYIDLLIYAIGTKWSQRPLCITGEWSPLFVRNPENTLNVWTSALAAWSQFFCFSIESQENKAQWEKMNSLLRKLYNFRKHLYCLMRKIFFCNDASVRSGSYRQRATIKRLYANFY